MDPDSYSEYGSGSTKLLNTDPDPQHCIVHRTVGRPALYWSRLSWHLRSCSQTLPKFFFIFSLSSLKLVWPDSWSWQRKLLVTGSWGPGTMNKKNLSPGFDSLIIEKIRRNIVFYMKIFLFVIIFICFIFFYHFHFQNTKVDNKFYPTFYPKRSASNLHGSFQILSKRRIRSASLIKYFFFL